MNFNFSAASAAEIGPNQNLFLQKEIKDRKENELRNAIERRNLDRIRELIAEGVSPNIHSYRHGTTALILAIYLKDYEFMNQLIEAGADPNLEDYIIPDIFYDTGLTPLYYNKDITPLIHAAKAGDIRAANILLDAGADINKGDKYKWTPLYWAARFNKPHFIKFLFAQPNLKDIPDTYGKTVIDMAKEGRFFSPEVNKILINMIPYKERRRLNKILRLKHVSLPKNTKAVESLGRAGTHENVWRNVLGPMIGPSKLDGGGHRRRKTRATRRHRRRTHKRRA